MLVELVRVTWFRCAAKKLYRLAYESEKQASTVRFESATYRVNIQREADIEHASSIRRSTSGIRDHQQGFG